MSRVDLSELVKGPLTTAAVIILAFLWLDTRHDVAGAAELAEINAKIYATSLEVARLTGVQLLYQAKEESGIISAQERARFSAVLRELNAREAELRQLENQRIGL